MKRIHVDDAHTAIPAIELAAQLAGVGFGYEREQILGPKALAVLFGRTSR